MTPIGSLPSQTLPSGIILIVEPPKGILLECQCLLFFFRAAEVYTAPNLIQKRQFHKQKPTVKLAVSVKVGVSVRVLVLMVRVQLA